MRRQGACNLFVRNKTEMWNLHSLSATYSRRPSEIAGVADEWAAYQFDLVVAQFGAWVEGKLNERDDKGKPKTTLAKLLGDKAQRQAAGASGMALPVTAIRKVRIKEDGTWDD